MLCYQHNNNTLNDVSCSSKAGPDSIPIFWTLWSAPFPEINNPTGGGLYRFRREKIPC